MDFSSDEMNMHVMQTEGTRSEAKNLCLVQHNTISPKNSNSVIGLVQGGLLAAFSISQRDTFLTRREFMGLLMCFKERDLPDIPPPTILKPVQLWTGKQVVTVVLPNINIYGDGFDFEKTDSSLVIMNGEFLSGLLSKKNIGPSTGSIIHIIRNDHSDHVAAQFLDTLKFTLNEWLKTQGFSVGISAAYMDDKEKTIETQIKSIVKNIEPNIEKFISEHKNLPADQLENLINEQLNRVVGTVGRIVLDNITRDNKLMQMVVGGSKGNENNIAQIIGLLGGQNVAGKRIGFGYHRRSLPHFEYNDQGAQSRGFVFNSYKNGLSPQEYFFHAMGGREGLVDTAIKTGEVGYISRKLMKAMEDLGVQYDNTIRNSAGDIIQYLYGEDGVDPCDLEMQFIQSVKMNWKQFCNEYKHTEEDMARFANTFKESTVVLEEEFNQLEKDREYVFELHNISNGLHCCSSLGAVYLPVNIDRVIKNALQKFRSNKSIIHPLYVIREFDKLESKLEQLRGERTMKSQPQCLKMMMIAVRSKLSSKQITNKYKFSSQAVQWIMNRIVEVFGNHLAEPGEMTGSIAAQSVGEPTQQMTLNSVSWDTEIVISYEGVGQQHKIGAWIDDLMSKSSKVQHLDNGTEYLELEEHQRVHIPTVDDDGKYSWGELSAVTRHPPHNDLVKVTTRSGKTVIATKSKSLLVWNEHQKKFVEILGSSIRVGHYMPSLMNMSNVENHVKYVELSRYLLKTEYIYGTDLWFAQQYMNMPIQGSKCEWFKENNGRLFTLPHTRYESITKLGSKSTVFERGCVYPFSSNRIVSTIPERLPLDSETGFFIGIYLAEGWATDTFVGISNHEDYILDKVRKWCDKYGVTHHTVTSTNKRFEGSKSVDLKIHSVILARLFGLWMNTGAERKRVPSEAFTAPDNFVKNLLDGYMSGDGTVNKRDYYVSCSSASKDLIQGISLLCNRFGIFGKMSSHQPTTNNVSSKDIKKVYTLNIRNKWATMWAKKIGSSHQEKQKILSEITHSGEGHYYKEANDFIIDPVVSVEHVSEALHPKVYDVTVLSTKNFVLANGLGVRDTFHSAGMSKANVTLGVPRVKEVIHAVQSPKAPTSHIFLDESISSNREKVFEMKTNIQGTKLKDILVSELSSVYYEKETLIPPFTTQFEEDTYWVRLYYTIMFNGASDPSILSHYIIRLVFDENKLEKRGLTVNSIANHLTQLLGDEMLVLYSDTNYSKPVIRLRLVYDKPLDDSDDRKNEEKFLKQYLRQHLKEFVLCGASSIKNVYVESSVKKQYNPITKEIDEKDEWYLLTEGSDLKSVLNWAGVDSVRTLSNNPIEILQVLGIEAARQSIMLEIRKVMNYYGIGVNYRHLSMLADIMTARGAVMPINRHGINRTDESPMKKCTFEETVDMLLDAGKDAIYDDLNAVSSNIIVGKIAKLGTGMFDLNWDNTYNRKESEQKSVQSVSKYKKMEHEDRKQRRKTVVISPVRENRYIEGQYAPEPTLQIQSEPILDQLDNFDPQQPIDTQSLFNDLMDF